MADYVYSWVRSKNGEVLILVGNSVDPSDWRRVRTVPCPSSRSGQKEKSRGTSQDVASGETSTGKRSTRRRNGFQRVDPVGNTHTRDSGRTWSSRIPNPVSKTPGSNLTEEVKRHTKTHPMTWRDLSQRCRHLTQIDIVEGNLSTVTASRTSWTVPHSRTTHSRHQRRQK